MSTDSPTPPYYRFGRFTLDLPRGTLKKATGDIPLRPKSFAVLRILVENHGRLVEKDRLHAEVWDRSSVSDESLTQCLVDIRKAIGDDRRDIIKTVPRRGYVFDAPVEVFDDDPGHADESRRPAVPLPRIALGAIGVVAAALVAVVVWTISTTDDARPRRNLVAPGPAVPGEVAVPEVEAHYASYLKGMELLQRRTGTAIAGAIEFFREAIRLDPGFALAYVGLADSYLLLSSHGEQSPEDVLPRAYAAAQTALELDENLGEAYATLGAIFSEAEEFHVDLGVSGNPDAFFERAMELSPDYATLHQWYGEYVQRTVGRAAAIEHFRVALALDPSSPINNHMLARALASQGRFDEAEQLFLRAVSIDPGFSRAHQGLAVLYFSNLGRLADAAAAAHKAALLNPDDSVNAALLANIYINMGDFAEAGHWLREGRHGQSDHPIYQMIVAFWHVMRDDTVAAASLLESLNRNPEGRGFTARLLKDHYIREGDLAAALAVCERWFPGVMTLSPSTDFSDNPYFAVECANVLTMLDRPDVAEEIVRRVRPLFDPGLADNEERALVARSMLHAMAGEPEPAMTLLREAIDRGWRYNALYYLEKSSSFARLHDTGEYKALLADYRALLADEREKLASYFSTAEI